MFAPLSRRSVLGGMLATGLYAGVQGSQASGKTGANFSRLNKGFNLPGWAGLDDQRAPDTALLQTLFDLGFAHIRLPLDPENILAGGANVLSHIARCARQLHAAGFALTFDMHPEQPLIDLFGTDLKLASDLTAAAWTQLAPVLADLPPGTCFAELLNEPPLEQTDWLDLRERLAATVRQICPDHGLIWGAARYQGIDETITCPTLADVNAAAAVHYYTPIGFTHQCADWSGPALQRVGNLPFPARRNDPAVIALMEALAREGNAEAQAFLEQEFEADWTRTRIIRDFEKIGNWSRQENCPVLLNEFGVLNFCVDPQSRARWIATVRAAAEENGIAWTYWELDQGFGFVADRHDARSIDPVMINALLEV